jgi:hypothetical protein
MLQASAIKRQQSTESAAAPNGHAVAGPQDVNVAAYAAMNRR